MRCCRLGLLAFLLSWGCREADAGLEPAAPRARLEARIAGCAEQRPLGACELEAARLLTLWIASPAAPFQVELDGKAIPATQRTVQHGEQLRIAVPAGAQRLKVSQGDRAFSLVFTAPVPFPALERARTQMERGELGAACPAIARLFDEPTPELAARALSLGARCELRRGDVDASLRLFERSSKLAASLGLRVAATRDRQMIAYIHEHRRFAPDEARAALADTDPALHLSSAWALFHQAAIAYYTGDARSTLRLAEQVGIEAERLAQVSMQLQMGEILIWQLADLGRFAELREHAARLRQLVGKDPCDVARLAVNLGWVELSGQGGDARQSRLDSELAARIYATDCVDVQKRQNALINVAIADWKIGDYPAAQRELDGALALGPTQGWMRAWQLELEGRLALGERRFGDALRIYREAAERADLAMDLAARHQSSLGIGRALAALGELEPAAEAFARAEQSLDDELSRVPLAEGRDTFSGERDASARELVGVLIALDRPDDALLAARRARARGLRALGLRSQQTRESSQLARWRASLERYRAARAELLSGDREAWTLPLTEVAAFRAEQAARRRSAESALDQAFAELETTEPHFSAPAPGELVLMAHPLPEGWAVFAQSSAVTRVVRVAELPPASDRVAVSAAVLAPLEAALDGARSVRIIPYGPLKEVDFHALPWKDGLLIDAVAVSYGSDLGAPDEVTRGGESRGGLVISDPGSDLPVARSEGELVARSLASRMTTRALVGKEASHAAMLEVLSGVDLLHFAGHADFVSGGWQSGLRLADGSHLEPGDILSLPSVPRQVVLSGCETMRESADVSVASLGIAQAFLARGSQTVVATTRPVPDALGLALSRALLAPGRESLDAVQFRDVLREVRAADTGDSWTSYRLLVP